MGIDCTERKGNRRQGEWRTFAPNPEVCAGATRPGLGRRDSAYRGDVGLNAQDTRRVRA